MLTEVDLSFALSFAVCGNLIRTYPIRIIPYYTEFMRHEIRAHFFYAACNLCDFCPPKYYNFRLKLYDCFEIKIYVLSFALYYYTYYYII